MEYAVRGALAIRAEDLKTAIAKNERNDYTFKSIVNCNIGNPQQLEQKPITFFRQVREGGKEGGRAMSFH